MRGSQIFHFFVDLVVFLPRVLNSNNSILFILMLLFPFLAFCFHVTAYRNTVLFRYILLAISRFSQMFQFLIQNLLTFIFTVFQLLSYFLSLFEEVNSWSIYYKFAQVLLFSHNNSLVSYSYFIVA